MTETIRYGVIGSGLMGFEHIRNIALVPGAEVTALADPHEPSRAWGRETAGHEIAVFDDYRDLLAAEGVDAVVISTPNFTHADILEDVFRYPKLHVLVEKPLCTELADCRVVEPADDIDPEYAAALRKAARAGVEVVALGARVTARAIRVERELPVRL